MDLCSMQCWYLGYGTASDEIHVRHVFGNHSFIYLVRRWPLLDLAAVKSVTMQDIRALAMVLRPTKWD